MPRDVRSAALKLNLCDYRRGDSGATTRVPFVEDLVLALRDHCPDLERIVLLEHDSSGTRANDLFALLGFSELARRRDLELFQPRTAVWRGVDTVGPLPVAIPEVVYEVDLLVNVPKMKFHGKTAFTGALKNNFGLIERKWKLPYHERLCESIVAANAHLPRQLVVMDGSVTLEGRGPTYGIPFRSRLALGGWDPVAVDTAAARLLGLPPPLLGHIRLAQRAGLGSCRPIFHWRDRGAYPPQLPSFDWFRFLVANALRRS